MRQLRTTSTLVVMAVVAAQLAGCGSPGTSPPGTRPAGTGPSGPPTTSAAATPAVPGPLGSCQRRLAYWVNELVQRRDRGYDYQEMGLTGPEYEQVRRMVGTARQHRERADSRWITAQTEAACLRISASPPPSPGPGWPN